jgi:hypothetical protein
VVKSLNVKRLRGLGLIALAALAGCSTPALAPYTSSRDVLFHLQQLPPGKAAVGAVTGGPRSLEAAAEGLVCDIKVRKGADGRPFDYRDYIRDSLIAELQSANRYDAAQGQPVITGTVEYLSMERELPFKATWVVLLKLTSSNGAELEVRGDHEFDLGDLAGYTGCVRAVRAFEPAVRTALEAAARSPRFGTLLAS